MPDENVTQLSPMRSSYVVCTCDNDKTDNILNEAVCSKEKSITCDVIRSKPYQRNTCYAKRKRRALQSKLSFIPNNFVQHHNRLKASNFFFTSPELLTQVTYCKSFRLSSSVFILRCVLTTKLLQLTINLNFSLKKHGHVFIKYGLIHLWCKKNMLVNFTTLVPQGPLGLGGKMV